MTTVKKTIHAKLMAARKSFHECEIKKTGYNSFSKYDYFELADFLIPAMGILADNDLIAITSFEAELATMTVIDVTTGESFYITSPMSTATLKACQPVQSMGACQTFVRRYLYTTLFEIVEHDAVEAQTGSPESAKPEKKPTILASKAQRATIDDYRAMGTIDDKKTKSGQLMTEWLDQRTDTLTERQATGVIAKIEKMVGEPNE
jgi:hypothetical protein